MQEFGVVRCVLHPGILKMGDIWDIAPVNLLKYTENHNGILYTGNGFMKQLADLRVESLIWW